MLREKGEGLKRKGGEKDRTDLSRVEDTSQSLRSLQGTRTHESVGVFRRAGHIT